MCTVYLFADYLGTVSVEWVLQRRVAGRHMEQLMGKDMKASSYLQM